MLRRARSYGAALAVLLTGATWLTPVHAQRGAQNGAWRSYGGDRTPELIALTLPWRDC